MWNGRIQNVWRSVRFFHIQWEPSIVRTCNYILFMREYQFLPSLQFCLKKQEKTRLSKKRWHVRQLPRHKAIKKTKRVSFNPSTGLALSPSKKTLAPRKPTVRLYSTVTKKNWTVILKISHRVNRGPFSRTTRQWSMVFLLKYYFFFQSERL